MVKRPKRFATGDEVYSDYGSDEGRGAAGSSEIVTAPESTRGAAGTSETVKPKVAPKADTAAIIAKGQANNEADRKATEAAEAKALEQSKTTKPAADKKETYRDFSGNIQTKKSTADRDAESAARREKVMDTVKSIGSGIGSLFSKAKQNYESTRPVSKQVQKERAQAAARGNLAKGGKVSSASSRADGIAQKGKTRGRMC